MAIAHALLLKSRDADAPDEALVALISDAVAQWPWPVAQVRTHRSVRGGEIYAYLELERPLEVSAAEVARLSAPLRSHPALRPHAPAIHRLERTFDAAGASTNEKATFHYVVEMDPADGWFDEIVRWYDTEHMPGLAAAPGCVRAQRFINHDGGPFSLACYDLTQPEATESPPWLAVRYTAWSDRVRPQFRNTKRTMFRTLPERRQKP